MNERAFLVLKYTHEYMTRVLRDVSEGVAPEDVAKGLQAFIVSKGREHPEHIGEVLAAVVGYDQLLAYAITVAEEVGTDDSE